MAQTYELNRSILEENLGSATGGRYKVTWRWAGSDVVSYPLTGGGKLEDTWTFPKAILANIASQLQDTSILPKAILANIASQHQEPDVVIGADSRPPVLASERSDDFESMESLVLSGSIFVGLCSIAFVGGFSRFQAGESTHAQRGWTMSWLAFGILLGPLLSLFPALLEVGTMDSFSALRYRLALFLAFFAYGVPALGGFVVVSQMIWSYGNCEQLF